MRNLPKWASEKINDQERTIAELREHVSMLQGSQQKSNIFWQDGFRSPEVYIPDGATVQLNTGNGKYIQVQIRQDYGGISIYAEHEIAVIPHASNVVVVRDVGR